MAKDLIFEVFTEEIPASFLEQGLKELESKAVKAFEEENITYKSLKTLGTPRRMALLVTGVIEKTPDKKEVVKGPNVKAAYDSDKKPTKALEGFLRSKNLKEKDLKTISDNKGEYVSATILTKGKATEKILPEILENIIKSIHFKKVMHWSDHEVSFVRPLHSIIALFGNNKNTKKIPLTYGHVKSGNKTRGHRFLANNKIITITSAGEYEKKLKENFVIVDPEKRRDIIVKGIEKAETKLNAKVIENFDLIDETKNLVEYPNIVVGNYEKDFLKLPKEIIIDALAEHQRYFCFSDKKGNLVPHFITVSNMKAPSMKKIKEGNEKVLRARLNDARFYYNKDIETPLTEYTKKLKDVVFQARLGTSYDKVKRFLHLSLYIGEKLGISDAQKGNDTLENFLSDSHNPALVKTENSLQKNRLIIGRSAALAKADLVTGVIYEFPELQGIMGSYYALNDKEATEVATAIPEHYMPTQAGSTLPKTEIGAIVSMADKMDTVAGLFGVGLIPTGAQDPYALRRQVLGILSIIENKKFTIDIKDLVIEAVEQINDKIINDKQTGEVIEEILNFIKERLKNKLSSDKLSPDAIDSVLSTPWYDTLDAKQRIMAIEKFKKHKDCANLTESFKRVSNILKKNIVTGTPDENLFEKTEEKELYKIVQNLKPVIEGYSFEGNYEKCFTELASVKNTIDSFFDNVMVMTEDEQIKENRLRLLGELRSLYSDIADLSKLN